MRFYFDVISPYAFLGWRRIHELAARVQEPLEPVPILFAALLSHHGHRGPAEIAPKRVYTFKHVVRLAHELGVGIEPPPHHPFNPLLGLRIATAACGRPDARAIIDAVFDAVWAGGPGCEDPEALASWLAARGLPAAELLAAAVTPEIKQALRRATEDAIALGVFGVPTVETRGELFWGQDSFTHIEAFLAGRDPVAVAAPRWTGITASATRPGGG
jgi:2-hydroxychromene-2-carboxylate isomerase